MTLPTFVIGGAPKAGTTALGAWLTGHPQVWMSPIAEPHFLTRDVNHPAPGVRIAGPPRVDTYRRGLAWYEELFAPGEDFPARGEASTHYLGATDTPDLMNLHVPALKVVFVLRQPVDRAYAHYWQGIKRGWTMPPFAALLDDHPALRYLDHASRYRMHLERYRAALGADRMHLIVFDDLRKDPTRVWREVCRFIGVDPGHQPRFDVERNPHAEPAHGTLHRLIGRTKYGRWTSVPPAVRRTARRVRDRVETWNLRRAVYSPMDPVVRLELQRRFEADIAYVEAVVRPLPEWRISGERGA